MEYVSAEWVVDEQMGTRVIKAIGDDGQTYWVPEADTDVPPWPDFLAKHGVRAIKEASVTKPAPAKAKAKTGR
jgi:hypothetical protein